MADDPILEEIWAIRAQIMEECDNDPHKFFEYIQARSKELGLKTVTLEPRPPLHPALSKKS